MVAVCRRFGEIQCDHLRLCLTTLADYLVGSFFDTENGVRMFLRNTDEHLLDYTASQP
jgi:hypothetical protein